MVGVAGFEPTAPTPPVLRAATAVGTPNSWKSVVSQRLKIEYHNRNQEVKPCFTNNICTAFGTIFLKPPLLPV